MKGNCQSHVFHQYTLRVINGMRDALADYLTEVTFPSWNGGYSASQQKAYVDTYSSGNVNMISVQWNVIAYAF